MYRETLTLGVVPNKRSFLSMVEAKRQKDCFMEEIRKIKASIVEIVDIDDICENGIVYVLYSLNRIKRLTVLQLYAIWKAIEQKWENLI